METFERFIEQYPQSEFLPEALFMLGDSLFSLGELSRAAIVFEQLIGDYPKSPRLPETMFLSVMAQRIVDNYPDSPQAPMAAYQLGEMYYRQSKYAEALNLFKLVVEQYPNASDAVALVEPMIEDTERRVNYPDPSNLRSQPWERPVTPRIFVQTARRAADNPSRRSAGSHRWYAGDTRPCRMPLD